MTDSKELTLADERALLVKPDGSEARRDLIKRQLCPGASDLELDYFLSVSRELGLSPLSREIYAIMRNTRQQVNGQWQSIPKMTIQVGIDGFRAIGARTGRFGGMRGPYWCGPDGDWHDVWLSEEPPAAAKVDIVLSDTRETVTGIATWKEFAQWLPSRDNAPPKLGELWLKMPSHMLAKCAEAQGWRKAQTLRTLSSVEFTAEDEPHRDIMSPKVVIGESAPPSITLFQRDGEDDDSFRARVREQQELRAALLDESIPASARGGDVNDLYIQEQAAPALPTSKAAAKPYDEFKASVQNMPPAHQDGQQSDAMVVCTLCGEHEAAGFWGEKEACQTCIDRELAAEAEATVPIPFPDSKPGSIAAFQMEAFNRLGLQPMQITRILGENWSKGKKAADLPGIWAQIQQPTEQLALGE